MACRRTYCQLHQAGCDLVARVPNLRAVAILVVVLAAIDRAAEHIDVRIDTNAAEHRAEPTVGIGAVRAGGVDTPSLAGAHDLLHVLGTERHQAADRAGAVDVGGRAAHHVDAADQLGIEEERAVGVVSGALVILPRAIDHDGDTAEILQASDIDDGRGIVAALLEGDAGDVVENIRQSFRLQALDLLQRHHRDRRQRIDGALFGLRCRNRDGIERLDCGAGLRIGIQDRSGRSLRRLLLRLRRFALRLLQLLLFCRAVGVRRLRHRSRRKRQRHGKCRRAQNKGARTPSPESHVPQPVCLLLGFGWRALQRCAAASWLTTVLDASHALAPRFSWLRRSAETVNRCNRHFISIVKLRRLDCAPIELYTPADAGTWGATREMMTAAGDNSGATGKPSDKSATAARSIAMSGNRIESSALFAAEREIIIAHGEDSYRLRLTSQNKLILTK